MGKSTTFNGTVSQDWTDAANWSNGKPVAGDTATISKSVTLTNLDLVSESITGPLNYTMTFNGTLSGTTPQMIVDTGTTIKVGAGIHNFETLVVNGAFLNSGTIADDGDLGISVNADGSTAGQFINGGTLSFTNSANNGPASAGMSVTGSGTFENHGSILLFASKDNVQDFTVTLPALTGDGTITLNGYASSDFQDMNLSGGIQSTMSITIAEAELSFAANPQGYNSAASLTFQDNHTSIYASGKAIVNFADITQTREMMPIYGFQSGESITLGTNQIASLSYDPTTDTLALYGSAGMELASLNLIPVGQQVYHTSDFTLASAYTASQGMVLSVDVACYCPGTLILTPHGEKPIETLAIGDAVITDGGHPEPIVWIGHRTYSARFAAGRPDLMPIRIAHSALGAGLPRRALYVSPKHALYLDGVLVPARLLLDGHRITQSAPAGPISYVHIELARHAVIFAEGAAAESFVDDGSRRMFQNACDDPEAPRSPAQFCAPVVEDGPGLDRIRRRLSVRPHLAMAS